jgi:hypothetical protein
MAELASRLHNVHEDDPDEIKGPGGLTLRQIHDQVRKSVARDREAQKTKSEPAQKPGWWRRFLRCVRERKGGW